MTNSKKIYIVCETWDYSGDTEVSPILHCYSSLKKARNKIIRCRDQDAVDGVLSRVQDDNYFLVVEKDVYFIKDHDGSRWYESKVIESVVE